VRSRCDTLPSRLIFPLTNLAPHRHPSPFLLFETGGVKLHRRPPTSQRIHSPSRPIKGSFRTAVHNHTLCCPWFHSFMPPPTPHRVSPLLFTLHRCWPCLTVEPATKALGQDPRHRRGTAMCKILVLWDHVRAVVRLGTMLTGVQGSRPIRLQLQAQIRISTAMLTTVQPLQQGRIKLVLA
jgi:hypothetical protein